jgi:uncharacterized RDD family membrane protein YckC
LKCPECGYVSFDFLDKCKKCGCDFSGIFEDNKIRTVKPESISVFGEPELSEKPEESPKQDWKEEPEETSKNVEEELLGMKTSEEPEEMGAELEDVSLKEKKEKPSEEETKNGAEILQDEAPEQEEKKPEAADSGGEASQDELAAQWEAALLEGEQTEEKKEEAPAKEEPLLKKEIAEEDEGLEIDRKVLELAKEVDKDEKEMEEGKDKEEERPAPIEREKAGFGQRLMAQILDCSLLCLINVLFMAFFLFTIIGWDIIFSDFFSMSLLKSQILYSKMTFFFLFLLISFSYFVYFLWKDGQTIGKMLLNIQVVSEEGEPLGLFRVLCRTVLLPVSFLFLGLGVLWILFEKNRQAWHDKICRTFVVKVDA